MVEPGFPELLHLLEDASTVVIEIAESIDQPDAFVGVRFEESLQT